MRHSKLRLLVLAIVAATYSSLLFAEEAAKLEGRWKANAAIRDGKLRDAMNFDGMYWVIRKDSLEIIPGRNTPAGLAGKPALKCSFAVDETQLPAHFDWTIGEGERKLTVKAIYELKGDVLRICFAPRNQPRPDGFDTAGKKCVVYEFLRSEGDSIAK